MFKTAKTPSSAFGKWMTRFGAAWAARRELAALSSLGEREFQDIGWGQRDRWSAALELHAPKDGPDRRRALVPPRRWAA